MSTLQHIGCIPGLTSKLSVHFYLLLSQTRSPFVVLPQGTHDGQARPKRPPLGIPKVEYRFASQAKKACRRALRCLP